MLYLLIPTALFAVWFSLRYAWWARPVDYKHPRILMYHMISDAKPGARFNGLRVAPAMFDQQLAWLSAQGWRFMTLSELMAAPEQAKAKTVVLTFDDGYADNCTQALPIMRKYGAKGTLFLVEQRHDNDWSTKKKAHHQGGELMQEAKLDNTQVQEMLDSGLVELGAHTFSHPKLTNLQAAQRAHEVIAIKQHLEQTYKVPVDSFAYPFGIYDPEDVALAERAGYRAAVTTEAGIDLDLLHKPLELKRVKISGKDGLFAFKMRMRTGKRGWNK